jgi:hypothetical protein
MMKTGFQALLILFIVAGGHFLAGNAYSQFAQALGLVKAGGFNCSPAPCVLPPTQASEGGSIVTDSLIVPNPLNQKELLLGSFDGNCYPSALGFHLSRDGGSTWKRVLCMPFFYTKNFVYVPSFEPAVGYDRNGIAYAAGFYNDNEGGSHGFLAVQKSSDGADWSKSVVAMRQPGNTQPLWTSLTVDTSPSSPWVNSVYVSGVMRSHSGYQNQVLISHSTDGGATWAQAAVDSVQKHPAEDDFRRMVVGKNGTVYLTWMHCPGSGTDRGCNENIGYTKFSRSVDGGNTWSPLNR